MEAVMNYSASNERMHRLANFAGVEATPDQVRRWLKIGAVIIGLLFFYSSPG
jgi:hypothetical protein